MDLTEADAVEVEPAPTSRKRGQSSTSAQATKRSKPSGSTTFTAACDPELLASLAAAKLKFSEFCDGLLLRWEGVNAVANDAAAMAMVESFSALNGLTKSHLAK